MLSGADRLECQNPPLAIPAQVSPCASAARRSSDVCGAANEVVSGDQVSEMGASMIILGIVLLVIGFVLKVAIAWTIGIILLLIGVILALFGAAGRMVGPRRHYW
jgi:hypothetical protein